MRGMRKTPWVGLLVVVLFGCTSNPARPARSSVGCAQAVVDQQLPVHLGDKLAHCMAGALIAHYCSPTEARMAAFAKEIRDAFTGGDVEWADVEATLAGVRCASNAADVTAVQACCVSTCVACARAPHAADAAR